MVPKTMFYAFFVSGVIARWLAFIYLTMNTSKKNVKKAALPRIKINFHKITVAKPATSMFLKYGTKFRCPCVSIHCAIYATVSQTVILRNV